MYIFSHLKFADAQLKSPCVWILFCGTVWKMCIQLWLASIMSLGKSTKIAWSDKRDNMAWLLSFCKHIKKHINRKISINLICEGKYLKQLPGNYYLLIIFWSFYTSQKFYVTNHHFWKRFKNKEIRFLSWIYNSNRSVW